jgi:hypothetical protein
LRWRECPTYLGCFHGGIVTTDEIVPPSLPGQINPPTEAGGERSLFVFCRRWNVLHRDNERDEYKNAAHDPKGLTHLGNLGV